MDDRCGAMFYDLHTTRMDRCERVPDHKDHGYLTHSSGVLRWYDVSDIPQAPASVCVDLRGQIGTHHFSTNFAFCARCGIHRPRGTLGRSLTPEDWKGIRRS